MHYYIARWRVEECKVLASTDSLGLMAIEVNGESLITHRRFVFETEDHAQHDLENRIDQIFYQFALDYEKQTNGTMERYIKTYPALAHHIQEWRAFLEICKLVDAGATDLIYQSEIDEEVKKLVKLVTEEL